MYHLPEDPISQLVIIAIEEVVSMMPSQTSPDTAAGDMAGFGKLVDNVELEKTEPLSELSEPPAFVRPISKSRFVSAIMAQSIIGILFGASVLSQCQS